MNKTKKSLYYGTYEFGEFPPVQETNTFIHINNVIKERGLEIVVFENEEYKFVILDRERNVIKKFNRLTKLVIEMNIYEKDENNEDDDFEYDI